ncbi:MAG: hypothetical protein COX48_02550, partial [bacterium (Candidatus Stahlbacteria) CG23_combo_of_CG06-09_8_20_14_all_34_7]
SHTINGIGWAIFLIITGVLWLLPNRMVPDGSWFIVTGAILLAVNLLKNIIGIRSTSGYFWGTLLTLFGLMQLIDTKFQFLPIFFISIGALMIISGLLEIRFKSTHSENIKTYQKGD